NPTQKQILCKDKGNKTIIAHVSRHLNFLHIYRKRLNFREDLIFANFANRLGFAKNRSHEQCWQYVNTTQATFDS
ncbi:MAG: hypothetical protein PV344_05060, partial [Anaplasma sp.]|nr:hypothetical protein [Anaplasma sp.]